MRSQGRVGRTRGTAAAALQRRQRQAAAAAEAAGSGGGRRSEQSRQLATRHEPTCGGSQGRAWRRCCRRPPPPPPLPLHLGRHRLWGHPWPCQTPAQSSRLQEAKALSGAWCANTAAARGTLRIQALERQQGRRATRVPRHPGLAKHAWRAPWRLPVQPHFCSTKVVPLGRSARQAKPRVAAINGSRSSCRLWMGVRERGGRGGSSQRTTGASP